MPRTSEFEYENSTWLTLSLVAALAAFVVLSEFSIWSTFLEVDFLEGVLADGVVRTEEAAANQRRQALVGGFQLLAFFLCAGLFLRWIYTMSSNAHALLAPGLGTRPLAAAGWFLVPGLHLWKPLQVLRELFQASHPEHIEDWRQASVPHLLSLWWTLWLLFQGTLALALIADLWAESVAQLYIAAWGAVITGVVAAPLGIALAICAWRLHALQRSRFHHTAPLRVRQPWPTRSLDSRVPPA